VDGLLRRIHHSLVEEVTDDQGVVHRHPMWEVASRADPEKHLDVQIDAFIKHYQEVAARSRGTPEWAWQQPKLVMMIGAAGGDDLLASTAKEQIETKLRNLQDPARNTDAGTLEAAGHIYLVTPNEEGRSLGDEVVEALKAWQREELLPRMEAAGFTGPAAQRQAEELARRLVDDWNASARARNDLIIGAVQQAAIGGLLISQREGFGLALTEVMIKGKSGIGTRTGGIVLQVRDHVSGYLVDPLDEDNPDHEAERQRLVTDVARAMTTMVTEPERTREMGEQAKRDALGNFTTVHNLTKILELANEVLAKRVEERRQSPGGLFGNLINGLSGSLVGVLRSFVFMLLAGLPFAGFSGGRRTPPASQDGASPSLRGLAMILLPVMLLLSAFVMTVRHAQAAGEFGVRETVPPAVATRLVPEEEFAAWPQDAPAAPQTAPETQEDAAFLSHYDPLVAQALRDIRAVRPDLYEVVKAERVEITFSELEPGTAALAQEVFDGPWSGHVTIRVSEALRGEGVPVLATVLGHEFEHLKQMMRLYKLGPLGRWVRNHVLMVNGQTYEEAAAATSRQIAQSYPQAGADVLHYAELDFYEHESYAFTGASVVFWLTLLSDAGLLLFLVATPVGIWKLLRAFGHWRAAKRERIPVRVGRYPSRGSGMMLQPTSRGLGLRRAPTPSTWRRVWDYLGKAFSTGERGSALIPGGSDKEPGRGEPEGKPGRALPFFGQLSPEQLDVFFPHAQAKAIYAAIVRAIAQDDELYHGYFEAIRLAEEAAEHPELLRSERLYFLLVAAAATLVHGDYGLAVYLLLSVEQRSHEADVVDSLIARELSRLRSLTSLFLARAHYEVGVEEVVPEDIHKGSRFAEQGIEQLEVSTDPIDTLIMRQLGELLVVSYLHDPRLDTAAQTDAALRAIRRTGVEDPDLFFGASVAMVEWASELHEQGLPLGTEDAATAIRILQQADLPGDADPGRRLERARQLARMFAELNEWFGQPRDGIGAIPAFQVLAEQFFEQAIQLADEQDVFAETEGDVPLWAEAMERALVLSDIKEEIIEYFLETPPSDRADLVHRLRAKWATDWPDVRDELRSLVLGELHNEEWIQDARERRALYALYVELAEGQMQAADELEQYVMPGVRVQATERPWLLEAIRQIRQPGLPGLSDRGPGDTLYSGPAFLIPMLQAIGRWVQSHPMATALASVVLTLLGLLSGLGYSSSGVIGAILAPVGALLGVGLFGIAIMGGAIVGGNIARGTIKDIPSDLMEFVAEVIRTVPWSVPSSEIRRELDFLSYESLKVLDFLQDLKSLADAQGRPLMLLVNETDGLLLSLPWPREALRQLGIRVAVVRAGSSESHGDAFFLDPNLVSQTDLEFIVRERPHIVVLDGSDSVGRGTARYPNAYRQFRNVLLAINAAAGAKRREAGIPVSRRFARQLSQTDTFQQLEQRVEALRPGPGPSYVLGFWTASRQPHGIAADKELGQARFIPGRINLHDLGNPTVIVVQGFLDNESIRQAAQEGDQAAAALLARYPDFDTARRPGFFDDTPHHQRSYLKTLPVPRLVQFSALARAAYRRLAKARSSVSDTKLQEKEVPGERGEHGAVLPDVALFGLPQVVRWLAVQWRRIGQHLRAVANARDARSLKWSTVGAGPRAERAVARQEPAVAVEEDFVPADSAETADAIDRWLRGRTDGPFAVFLLPLLALPLAGLWAWGSGLGAPGWGVLTLWLPVVGLAGWLTGGRASGDTAQGQLAPPAPAQTRGWREVWPSYLPPFLSRLGQIITLKVNRITPSATTLSFNRSGNAPKTSLITPAERQTVPRLRNPSAISARRPSWKNGSFATALASIRGLSARVNADRAGVTVAVGAIVAATVVMGSLVGFGAIGQWLLGIGSGLGVLGSGLVGTVLGGGLFGLVRGGIEEVGGGAEFEEATLVRELSVDEAAQIDDALARLGR
ncbi:MAG: hypothetical protein Q8R78_00945, partial [Candidatus Omnitrophota bacterium]|nr:hypothetical protein [Candidatus Omnitrophota bacterium]